MFIVDPMYSIDNGRWFMFSLILDSCIDSMLARGVRNVIYNYTDAQRKVRSATSNDAWGPSPALMHEISDLTDNVVAYAEIMPSNVQTNRSSSTVNGLVLVDSYLEAFE
jgi:hypothetical protein